MLSGQSFLTKSGPADRQGLARSECILTRPGMARRLADEPADSPKRPGQPESGLRDTESESCGGFPGGRRGFQDSESYGLSRFMTARRTDCL